MLWYGQYLRVYAARRKCSTAWDGRRGRVILFFYVDDGRIAGRDHEWVQDALAVTVAMFWQMGIDKNLEKPRRWCAAMD